MPRNGGIFLVFKTRLSLVAIFSVMGMAIWYLLEPFALRNYLALIPLLFAIQIFMSDFLELYLVHEVRVGKKWFRLLIAPGTILHELSHLITALMTGATILSVSLFRLNPKSGVIGYVSYAQPRDRWVVFRDFIIGLSPFFGCGVLLLLFSIISSPANFYLDDLNIDGMSELLDSLSLVFSNFYDIGPNPLIILVLYVKVCLAIGSAPSTPDFRGLSYSLLRNPLSTLFFLVALSSAIFLGESSIMIFDYTMPEIMVLAFKAVILVLLISISVLAGSIPFAVIIDKFLEISLAERALTVLAPALLYLLNERADFLPEKQLILANAMLFLALLIAFRYRSLFLKD